MKKKKLVFYSMETENERLFHTVLRTRHGRRVYLALELIEARNVYIVRECVYVDRVRIATPHKVVTREIPAALLEQVLMTELDCSAGVCTIIEGTFATKKQLIEKVKEAERPYILLLVPMGEGLYTCFKNRHRRAISLHVKLNNGSATIDDCHYCDARGRRTGRQYTPQGLLTISFSFSMEALLKIVNDELEGGFSGVIIADDYRLPSLDSPFCGRI